MSISHPFGHEIDQQVLLTLFNQPHWEERYRQLIKLANQMPNLPEQLKQSATEIKGCENRVWLGHHYQSDGTLHFYADSEGRIVRGLLAVLLTAIEGQTPQQLLAQNPLALFDKLNIRQQLSSSRTAGLEALAEQITHIARQYLPGNMK